MDLRTKLVFALVAVALGSMLALGFASYPLARDLLQESAIRTLEGVAESKASDLENLTAAWRDRVRLIGSRTQLLMSLAAYNASPDTASVARIRRILGDARRSTPAVRSITVYDTAGQPIASTSGLLGATVRSIPSPDTEGDVSYAGLRSVNGDSIDIVFVAPLRQDSVRIGTLEAVLVARELLDITGDHTGLGETGEVVIAERIGADSARIVNSTRHEGGAPLGRRVGLGRTDDPVALALRRSPVPLRQAIDYRGEPVWAATRYLPDLGWGLVVKFDAAEQERSVHELRRYMVRLALAISAFAILTGTLLGLHLARPIRELADVANRIRTGDLDARAVARSDDETGDLARTFNLMAEQLIETNRELSRRVGPDRAGSSDVDGVEPPTR